MRNLPEEQRKLLRIAAVILLLTPYLIYVGLAVYTNRAPIDYETFMSIGSRLLAGSEVYGENSYYPMPYVMVFAAIAWLPRSVGIVFWLLGPVLAALFISGGNPLVLLFAPVFGHFAGGQSSVFGMLGLWGYRKHQEADHVEGGVWLGLTMLKPQLGIVPLVFAAAQWWKALCAEKRIPRQAWAFAVTTALIYLPGFLILPDWPARWLSSPRPLFERALSGFVPRTLLYLFPGQTGAYWLVLGGIAVLLFLAVWFMAGKQVTLDLAVLWGFVVNPLVHDYDLIQLVPLLDRGKRMLAAVLLSLPGWLVFLFAYTNDSAWYAFTIIAPGVLGAVLWEWCKPNVSGAVMDFDRIK
jgi:hypothetical protein